MMWKKENQFFKYFWRILLKYEEKVLEINKHGWLFINWIPKKSHTPQQPLLKTFQKSNYLIDPFWVKSIEIHIRQLELSLCSTNFVFYPDDHLAPLQILSHGESAAYLPVLHELYIKFYFFLLACNTDPILKSTLSLSVKTCNTKQSMEFLCSWAKSYYLHLWHLEVGNFERKLQI